MSKRVLLVDDAPFMLEILRQILSEIGYEVCGEAKNGMEAVELAQNLEPDMVIMDMVLPLKNGVEASKEILESHPEIKIIACSTVDQDTVLMSALDAGCIDYITKPFKKNDIVSVVNKIFSIPEETPA